MIWGGTQAPGRHGRDDREVCVDIIAEERMELWRELCVGIRKLGASWCLLDFETSGVHRDRDSIIAVFLARLEDGKTVEERAFLIRLEVPLEPWMERLTGISNRDLEQAMPPEDALMELDSIRERFLFLDREFMLPFLDNFYRRYGKEFSHRYLTLDCLLELLDIPPRQQITKLLKALPPPPESWPDLPPENVYLAQLYQLTRGLFYQLEKTE